MRIHYNKIRLALVAIVGILAGCSDDFLERKPLDTIVDANFYQTGDQVLAASAPLYNIVWFQYNDKASHGLGDGRGGVLSANYSYQLENIQFKTSSATAENITSWRAFYNVVGQANTLIANVNKYAGENVSPEMKRHALAEARFMRGVAYSYLVQNWGPVPIITNNETLLQDTTINRNTVESVWEFICRDLRYGTQHLPAVAVQEGRLTMWAAEGMLAKMYLTRAGVGRSVGSRNQLYLDSAKILAKSVIDKSGKSLMPNYEDLFKTRFNNNAETLFALQWAYNGNWGSQNSVQAFLAFSSSITGFADGWGGDLGASLFMLQKYEGLVAETGTGEPTFGSTTDKRRKATFMLPGDHYSYVHQQVLDDDGNPFVQELVVPVGGNGSNSRAWVKKYVVGRPEDNEGRVLQQRTEVQTYMLRLADVYLVYAEAVLGNAAVTSDPLALGYFNEIRRRAGVSEKTSLTWDDIFNERHLEFAMEGQMWYDYVRLHYYNPTLAESLLSQQDRGFTRITPDDPEEATEWRVEADPDYTGPRFFEVNSGNFTLQLPEAEVSRAPNLRKEPVPFEF